MADDIILGISVANYTSKEEVYDYDKVHVGTRVTMPTGATVLIPTNNLKAGIEEKNKSNGASITFSDRHNSIIINNACDCKPTGAKNKVNNITLFDCENTQLDVSFNNAQDNIWVRYSNGTSNKNNWIGTDVGDKVNGNIQNSYDITL